MKTSDRAVAGKRLRDLATVIRSKNAGPFELTIDLIFPDHQTWAEVAASQSLSAERIGDFFAIDPLDVEVYPYEPCLAIKITFPREVPGGSPGDSDCMGGQQHGALVDYVID